MEQTGTWELRTGGDWKLKAGGGCVAPTLGATRRNLSSRVSRGPFCLPKWEPPQLMVKVHGIQKNEHPVGVIFMMLRLLFLGSMLLRGTIVSAVEISSLNGTVGKSILLCIATDYGNETRSIEWIDKTRNQLLFKIQPGETESNWTTAQDTYKGRLSVHDMRCLKIENLTSEDSGLYEVEIKLNTGEIKPQIFNVTVSGTVTTESNMKPQNYWISIGIPVGIVCVVLLGIGVLKYKGKRKRLKLKEDGSIRSQSTISYKDAEMEGHPKQCICDFSVFSNKVCDALADV